MVEGELGEWRGSQGMGKEWMGGLGAGWGSGRVHG